MQKLRSSLVPLCAQLACATALHASATLPDPTTMPVSYASHGSWNAFVEVAECAAEAYAKGFTGEHRIEFMSRCHPLGSVVARWLVACAAAESPRKQEEVVGCLAARWALGMRH